MTTFAERIQSDWALSKTDISKLDKYYILHWSTEYFFKRLEIWETQILHQDIVYTVKFHNCDKSHFQWSDQVALSFRKSMLLNTGTVLVKPIDSHHA